MDINKLENKLLEARFNYGNMICAGAIGACGINIEDSLLHNLPLLGISSLFIMFVSIINIMKTLPKIK